MVYFLSYLNEEERYSDFRRNGLGNNTGVVSQSVPTEIGCLLLLFGLEVGLIGLIGGRPWLTHRLRSEFLPQKPAFPLVRVDKEKSGIRTSLPNCTCFSYT